MRRGGARTLPWILIPIQQRLPLTIPHAEKRARASSTRIIASTTTVSFGREPPFAVLAPVDDVLKSLSLPRLRDLRPIQILAWLSIVDNISHRTGGYLALTTSVGAGVHVG